MRPKKESAPPSARSEIAALLGAALRRLQKHNPLMSIRGLAAQVDVSPSYLSKIFRGERRLPASLIGDLAKVLRLDHHEVIEIHRLLLVDIEQSQISTATGLRTLEPNRKDSVPKSYRGLGTSEYWLLEDWYHIPIHNLATTLNFTDSAEWIARRLGVPEAQVKDSLKRQIREGYLARDAEGMLSKTSLRLRFPTERSHALIRRFHRSMIKKALDALEKPPTEEEFRQRLISGISFAGDPSRLEDAKVIIEEAMYRASELLANGDCTEVFQLNLQLFKVTRASSEPQ